MRVFGKSHTIITIRHYSTTQRVKCQLERKMDTRQRDCRDREKSRGSSVETEVACHVQN